MNLVKTSITALFVSVGLFFAVSGTAQEAPAAAAPPPAAAPAAKVQENHAPAVNGIPGESVKEGGTFALIKLDQYVTDKEDNAAAIRWTVSGNKDLKVVIVDRIATVKIPDKYWNGSEDITFVATDTKNASGSETVTFTVESVNNPPEVKQIPDQTIDEGKKFTIIKLDDYVIDMDHPKEQIIWETDVQAVGKEQAEGDISVVIDKNRMASINIPDTNWYGTAKITFTATDGEYASDKKTATFTVRPVNDAPIVQKSPDQTIKEKEEFEQINLSELVSDIDDDISTIKWSVSGGNQLKASIDKSNIATVKIPNVNWNGPTEAFTFTATDPKGASASFKTSFTVKSVNDAPEFIAGFPEQTIDEKQQFKPIALDKLIRDIDHTFEELKWTVTGNKDLKVQITGKEAKILIPNALWNGSETMTFKITDPEGASAEAQATFTVNSVNDAPVFVKPIPNQFIDEKKKFASFNIDEYIKDPDHKNAELSIDVNVKHQGKEPESGTLNISVNEKHIVTFEIPDTYWNGTAIATFTVTDPESAAAKQDVTYTVKSINDLPVFKKIPDQLVEEKSELNSINLDEFLSDADHDISKLKIELSGLKDIKTSLNPKTREVTFKVPNLYWNGSETLTIKATDPDGGSATTSVKLSVKSINDPPVLKDIPEQTIKEKQQFKPIELDNYVEDPDHEKNKLKWTASGNKELKVLIDANRKMTITPPSIYWNGSETLVIKVTDPENATDEKSVSFTIESINDLPEFVKKIDDQEINEKNEFAPIKLGEMIKDPDHKLEDLIWSFDVKPAPGSPKGYTPGLQVNLDAKRVATIQIPDKFWNGADQITFTATDPEGGKTSATAKFTVKSVNDLPVLKKIADQTIEEKQAFSEIHLQEFASDPDHSFDKLKWTTSGEKDLKVVIKSGIATISTPNNLWNGSEKITFTVTDPEGASATQTVTYTAKSINDPPVMKNIKDQTIKEKESFKEIELDDFVSDLDHSNKQLKWSVSGNKELKVAIDPNRKAVISAPNPLWHGSEAINFKVTDPEGASANQTVQFIIQSVNDKPVFIKPIPNQNIDEKKAFLPISLNDFINDPDHKKEDLTWSFEIKPAPGAPKNYVTALQVKLDEKGVATILTPNKYWNGAEQITFTAADPEGAMATSTALFTVKSINDAPVFKKINDQSILEKESFASFNLSELVEDPDDPYSKLKWDITGAKDLKVSMAKNGEVSVSTPNKLWNGMEKITFTVSDPEGASAKQTVTFAVKSINDPPVMKDIPSQKIKEKASFKVLSLDEYVSDLDHDNAKLKWKVEGNKELKAALDAARKLTVTAPNLYWHGSETLKLTVTDPEGASDTRSVVYTIESVNDKPVFVKEIQDQIIDEKKQFASINLSEFINDPDHKKEAISWTWKAVPLGAAITPAKGKRGKKAAPAPTVESPLKVNIDNKQVATIIIPDTYWHGGASITFTASDPEGATASSTMKAIVKSINDIPKISDKAPKGETIREGGVFSVIDLSTLAFDPDHKVSELKWTITGNKDLKVLIRKDNTVLVSVPHAQWFGKEELTFTVTDPEGGKDSHKMIFEATEVDDPPSLSSIPGQKIKEKESFKPIKLDDYVKDPDDPPAKLLWTVTGNKNLRASISPSRILTVTAPYPHYWGEQESLVLIVKDKAGGAASTIVTFEITSVNDAPVIKDIPDQKIKEKAEFKSIPLDNFVEDLDHKKEQLIWTAKIEKVGAKAPAPKRGKGKSKVAAVKEVASTNDVTVEIDDKRNAFIKLPSKFWHGERQVTFTVTDPEGAKDTKTVKFTVESVNDIPVMKPIPTQQIKEKESFKPIDLAGFVTDDDHPISALKFSIGNTRQLKASVNQKNQLLVTTPDKYWFGEEKITVTVEDPEGGKAVQQVIYKVDPVNDAPEIKGLKGQKIKEKEKFTVIDLGSFTSDPDNKPNELSWSASGNKDLKVEIRGSKAVVLTPNPFWFGKETITFTVKDPQGASASATVDFEVTPVNDPPSLKKVQPFTIDEKKSFAPVDFSKLVSDPDNKLEELSWTIDDEILPGKDSRGRPTKGRSSTVKHKMIFNIDQKGVLTARTPDPYWNGSETVVVNVFDPSGEKASVTVKFTVKPVNDPPVVIVIEGQETLEGKSFKPIKLDDHVKDPDNKNHEIKWSVTGNRHLDVMITSGREALIKPKRLDWFGEETLVFTAKDPAGASDKTVAKFVVKHVNSVPVIRNIPDYTIKEDDNKGVVAVIKLDQFARDKDHRFDELKWTFVGHKFLKVDYNPVTFEFKVSQPYKHWNGAPETITFTVTDPEGASATTKAKFTVIAVNDPPVAVSQAYQTKEGEVLKVNAANGLMAGAKDPDNEKPVEAVVVSKPQNGSVIVNSRDGSFTYTPNKGFYGLDEFTFKIKDKGGLYSKVETAEVNVSFKMKDLRKVDEVKNNSPAAAPKGKRKKK